MKFSILLATCLAVFAAPMMANAQLNYNELTDGELSNDPNTPTVLAFGLGDNFITGSVANSNDTTTGDRDFLTFSIAPGQVLNELFLTAQSPSNRGFHAISSGSTSVIPSGTGAGDTSTFLGSAHLDFITSDTDLLADLGTPLAGTGFTGPLGAGSYSYLIQQTGDITQNYTLNFSVATAVPEPTSAAVLLCGGGIAMIRRRRKNAV